MTPDALSGFEWILLFAILGSIVSTKLRIPPVAGLLVSGMVIGPNMLGLVQLPTIGIFADIGATLLLFMIGIEFSVSKLLKTGLRAILSALLLITIMFVVMHETAILLDFDALTSLYVAAIFSFSSTAIMMKILEQKGLIGRIEVPVLVAILIIEDIVAIFLITLFSELRAGDYTSGGILEAVIISLMVLGLFYFVLLKLFRRFSAILLDNQTEETLTLFSIALGVGMSILATFLGLTPAIGAFLAGSMISGLPNGNRFEQSIKPFSRLFSAFFFLSIGMLVNPMSLFASLGIAMTLISVFIVSVFLTVTFTFYLITSSGRSSIFAGLAMLPLGEFSLLIAKESVGVVEMDLVGIVSAGVLISSLLCSLVVGRSEHMHRILKNGLPVVFLRTLKDASGYAITVISAFEPGGAFHRLLMDESKRLVKDILFLAGASLLYIFSRAYLLFQLDIAGHRIPGEQALFLLLLLIAIVPLIKLTLSLKRVFDALSSIFSRTTPAESKGAILRNLLVSAISFLIFANMSLLLDVLMLPRFFNWFSVLFGSISLFFLWSALSSMSDGFPVSEKKIIDILNTRILVTKRHHGRTTGKSKGRGKVRNVHPLINHYE